jgi:energy-coupling factor transporter ATP-binding protein EcfA2
MDISGKGINALAARNNPMATKAIYFLTGASGSGKTTLLEGVIKSIYPDLSFHHFDDLGVPTLEEMIAKFGGPEQWQAYNVRRWIENIFQTDSSNLVILDGQARPNIILDAAHDLEFSQIHITLVDCSHTERQRRLLRDRKQPRLDMLDTYAWASYLHGQADALNLEIIDTTERSVEKSIQDLAKSIGRFAKKKGISLNKI